MTLLPTTEITERVKNLSGWDFSGDHLFKEYQLADFKSSLAFVNKIGDESEAMDHHPDILMHSWNKVKISISTHSAGGVTEKDFQFAEKIESLTHVTQNNKPPRFQ
jgi:4a-hydroxytetrahydrobiopterin dehydratase